MYSLMNRDLNFGYFSSLASVLMLYSLQDKIKVFVVLTVKYKNSLLN
jgi:hypothetical protein